MGNKHSKEKDPKKAMNKYFDQRLPMDIKNVILFFVGQRNLSVLLQKLMTSLLSDNCNAYYTQLAINYLDANKFDNHCELAAFFSSFTSDNTILINAVGIHSCDHLSGFRLFTKIDFMKHLSKISSLSRFVGKYECHKYDTFGKNLWHFVEIKLDPLNENALIWTNRAGVKWHLYKTDDPLKFQVGADCTYVRWREMMFRVDEKGTEITCLTGPDANTEIYDKQDEFSS